MDSAKSRLVVGLAVAAALVSAAAGAWFWWSASLGSPADQARRLDRFLHIPDPERAPSDPGPESVEYSILLAQDLTGDGITDFIIYDQSWGKCGSGGCQQGLYIGDARGKFRHLEDWDYNNDAEEYRLIARDGTRDDLLVGRMPGGEFIYPFHMVFDENKATGGFDLVAGWYCGSSPCVSPNSEQLSERVAFIPHPKVNDEAGETVKDPCPAVADRASKRPAMYIAPAMRVRTDSLGTARNEAWYKASANWSPDYFGVSADGRWYAYVDYKLGGAFYVKAADCPGA